ncbi:MAG: hypothetical protein VB086_09340 [Clostridiaceae bacterium]|nr:hypothetical protein [Clostridiaceae bacterium]
MVIAKTETKYRVIAFILAIAIVFSILSIPAKAIVVELIVGTIGVIGFADLVSYALTGQGAIPYAGTLINKYLVDKGVIPALDNGRYSPSQISSAYSDYVNDISSKLGTCVITNNGVRVYVQPSLSASYVNGIQYSYNKGVYVASGTISSNGSISFNYGGNKSIPFNAYVTTGMTYEVDNATYGSDVMYVVNGSVSTIGTTYSIAKNGLFQIQYCPYFISINTSNLSSMNISFWYDLAPYTGVIQNYYSDIDITTVNRMTGILPAVYSGNNSGSGYGYYIGTKTGDTISDVYAINVFDETTNVFTDPKTNITYNITGWTYDYSTRTYVCTDSNNNVYTVQYGDECIYVTVPDGSGGSTTTTYYYVRQSPAPNPGNTTDTTTFPNSSNDEYTDDNTTTGGFWSTIWKAFKDGLADLIAGIVKDLFKGLKAIISGILNVFSGLVTGFFDAVNGFFNSFSETGVFQFWNGTVTDLS